MEEKERELYRQLATVQKQKKGALAEYIRLGDLEMKIRVQIIELEIEKLQEPK